MNISGMRRRCLYHLASLLHLAVFLGLFVACTPQRTTPLDAGDPVPPDDAEAEEPDASVNPAVCVATTRRCSGNKVQRCEGEAWVDLEECSRVCADGACAGVCRPKEETRCSSDGRSSETCASDGNGFEPAETCSGFCVGKACASCKPGDRQCNNAQPQLCSMLGAWENDGESCTTGCNTAQGLCNGCPQVDDKKCVGTEVWTCSQAKTWVKEKSCEATQGCLAGVCTACRSGVSQPQCQGDSVVECAADGSWKVKQDCTASKVSCVSGSCGNCKTGDKICQGKIPRVCEMGQWVDRPACAVFCSNTDGQCRDCVPNEQRCSSNSAAVETCNASGSGWTSMACPATANATPICENKACKDSCNSGFTRCGDGTCRKECPRFDWIASGFGCARAVSADGNTILNEASTKIVFPSQLQTVLTAPNSNQSNGCSNPFARDVSEDGKIVVGYADCYNPSLPELPLTKAVRWAPTTGELLPQPSGGTSSYGAYLVSADGKTIVGVAPWWGVWKDGVAQGSFTGRYMRTAADVTSAGDYVLDNSSSSSNPAINATVTGATLGISLTQLQSASAISDDANTVLGISAGASVLWVRPNTLVTLPIVGVDMSRDGKIVVGRLMEDGLTHAALWKDGVGAKKISAALKEAGVANAPDAIDHIGAISRDGRVAIGCATRNGVKTSYRAVLP